MNKIFDNIATDMRELGLTALSHANKRYSNMDKGGELSVLKAAHSAEILIKARIAEEHPLLIFNKIPKYTNNELSLEALFENGSTIDWSKLPDLLWAATGTTIPDIDCYNEFGKLRNGIQHFGVLPSRYKNSTTPENETFKFIYSVIDPMIHDWWNLSALDYCEDKLINDEEYESFTEEDIYFKFVRFIISQELALNLPDFLISEREFWIDALESTSSEYKDIINKQIRT